MTEEQLLLRARNGDNEAFEALVTPHEQMVWRLCWRMTGSTEDAQDAMQETMLRAWRHLDSFRGQAAFSTWLYRVAVSACTDLLRRSAARPAASLEALAEAGFDPPDSAPTPEADLLRRERQAQTRAALNSLPEEQRTPLVLYAMEGKSYDEIAALLDTPAGTVKSRIHRAREKMLEFFSNDGNNPTPAASKPVKGGRKA